MKHSTDVKHSADAPATPGCSKPLLWSGLGIGLLILGIVGATYWQQGFVAAGRCATNLIMPVSILWLTLLGATLWLASLGKRGPAACMASLFLLWSILGNGEFAETMMARTETPLVASPHPALEKREQHDERIHPRLPLDAIVTLGGSASLVLEDFPELNRDGERLVSAAQAYWAGATETIITTGSSTDGIGNPSEVGRDILLSLGVPEEKIFMIQGQNTSQEMQRLAEFLADPPGDWREQMQANHPDPHSLSPNEPTIGLITSAYHMPRAMRLAETQDLNLLPLPCAFRTSAIERPWIASSLVPTAENLDLIGRVIKENLAYVLGR